jgi:predicted Zn-dependent protease
MTVQFRLVSAPEVVERGLRVAAQSVEGGDCIVIVTDTYDADVRFANNTTTTNGVRRDRSINVVRILDRSGGRLVGVASGSGPVDVADLVAAAEGDARAGVPVDDAAELISGGVDADFESPPLLTDLSVYSSLLPDLGAAFERARVENTLLSGFATHAASTAYLGSSTGLRRRVADTSGTFELIARADGGARSAWTGMGTDDFADVSVPRFEQRLLERLEWSKHRVELPAGRYEVIMPPDAVADLVLEIYFNMGGQDAEDGGTVFSKPGGTTRVGDQLAALPFVLFSDPNAPGIRCPDVFLTGASSSDTSVFDNGASLSRTNWIDEGRLAKLRYHRAGAARSDVPFAPAIDNLALEVPGASSSLDELVATTNRGLLLTCLWYIREVDPATLLLTGLTRDGVYLVEDGQVVGAVNNFRFNESPLDMLRDTIVAGSAERALSREWGEWMERTKMPALRVADFNMSSVSQAS